MSRRVPLRLIALVVAGSALLAPAAAQGATGIETFESFPSSTQAGGHANVLTRFTLSSHNGQHGSCGCEEDARDVTAHLPPGLIGNPSSTPQCDIALFSADECPVDSQVGVAYFGVSSAAGSGGYEEQTFLAPVYNMIPPPSQPGLLAFKSGGTFNTPTFEVVSARTDGDYGLDVAARSIEHISPLTGFEQITWGVPADPANDNFRFAFRQKSIFILSLLGSHYVPFCDANGEYSTADPASIVRLCPFEIAPNLHAVGEWAFGTVQSEVGPGYPIPSNSPLTPFIQNATTCDTPLTTTLEALSYDGGTSEAIAPWPPTTGCDRLTFNPSQAISPTTQAADSPSGAEFHLTVPQYESPNVPSPSELKAATVTFPPGFALAPNVMNGKTTCSAAEARFGSTAEAQCPENAKLGTMTVETPVLPGPLGGAAYLGEPIPGNRYRMFLVFDGFGVHVKLPGTITPDPQTGQLRIEFKDLPQAPFESFELHVFGSERGPLATPTRCGTFEVKSEWTPWDDVLSNQTSRQFFTIDEGPDGQPCPGSSRPFDPGFRAASASNTGGANTAFAVDLTRDDGDQNLAGLTIETPPGISAELKGIPYCSEASIARLSGSSYLGATELAAPLCSASRVGTITAGAGAGTHPLYLPGAAYLAGPYKGAPLSFVAVVPAVAGPYDLGNVVVRAAIHVDPLTAQVTTVSDAIPQIVGGIPIRSRRIQFNLNRPDFIVNPTDCDPLSVGATLTGDEGGQAIPSSHFQVASCASLPFAPKLALRLTGGVSRLGHPAIHALLQTQPGEANPSRISVTLPPSELLDQAHIGSVCTRAAFAAQSCPAGSLVGHAEVSTPLLDHPLRGSAYLRSSASGLPDLAIDLQGQIDVEAVAHVDSVDGGLRTTFETVPDVPLGTVALDLLGGRKGLVQNSETLCGTHKRAKAAMRGQNGKSLNRRVPLRAVCGKKGGRRR